MKSQIFSYRLFHHRLQPTQYNFHHSGFLFWLDISELPALSQKWWFGWNKPAIFSLYDKDHFRFRRDVAPIQERVAEFFTSRNEPLPDEVYLLTNLRMFGYTFNPVSFYYCRKSGQPQFSHVLMEVNNTFGEQHSALFPLQGDRSEFRIPKDFYVSPFIPDDAEFRIEIPQPGDSGLRIRIDSVTEEATILEAGMSGKFSALTGKNLLKVIFRYQWVTFKTIFFIHFHAFRLYLKKVPFYGKRESDKRIAARIAARQEKA